MATVSLISHTPNPVKTVAAAAKLCYSRSDVETLLEGLDEHKAADFVRRLTTLGHESPFEHVSFTFGLSGVSRALLAQITRHRIASYSVQSQRYVEKNSFSYIVPPQIERCPAAKEEFLRCMEQCEKSYERLTELLTESCLAGAADESLLKNAKKQAIEDARFVLPNACDTKMIVTMNTRSLYNFFRHRLCNRAQWEIRQVGEEMFRLVHEAAPVLFEHAGPPCSVGPCPEGKMSCGRRLEMKEKYDAIKAAR